MVHAAGNASLAILEMLMYLKADDLLQPCVIFEASFDEPLMKAVESAALPKRWRRSPPPPAGHQIGGRWVAGADSAVLQVPSVIVPAEWNYPLNPAGFREDRPWSETANQL